MKANFFTLRAASLIAVILWVGSPTQAQTLYMDVNGATAGFGDYKPSQSWSTTAGGSIWSTSSAGTATTATYTSLGGGSSSNVVFDLTDVSGATSSNTPIALQQNTTVNSLTINNGKAKTTFTGVVSGTTLTIGTLNITGTTTTNDPFNIGSNLTLTGNIIVNGQANKFIRLGANYSGTVTLNSGLLTDTGATTAVNFSTGTAVQSNTGAISLGSISGSGALQATFGGGYTVTQVVNGTFSGNIAAAGSGVSANGFTKKGNATLTLTGAAKAYTNTTSVDAGTLMVNTSLAASSGVIVKSAARLGGVGGTVTGVTVQSGGHLGGIGVKDTLSTGALSLQGTASFDLELNILNATTVTNDFYNTTGNFSLDLANTVVLTLSNIGANLKLEDDIVLTLVDYSGVWNGGKFIYDGTVLLDDDQFTFGVNTFRISYNGLSGSDTVVILQAIPEPGVGALMWVGLASLALFRRMKTGRIN